MASPPGAGSSSPHDEGSGAQPQRARVQEGLRILS